MKPEDEARLEVIRADWRAVYSAANADYGLFLRIIDEQAAEIARLETQSENQARIIDTQRRLAQCGESKFEAENEVLKEQLAEERAKREAMSEAFQAERTMLVENQFALAAQVDKAERELAESNSIRGDALRSCAIVEERAEKAEARIAELQALVDAATRFEVQGIRLHKRRGDGKWDVAVDDGSGSRRNGEPLTHLLDALALARDLAAKEKEPT